MASIKDIPVLDRLRNQIGYFYMFPILAIAKQSLKFRVNTVDFHSNFYMFHSFHKCLLQIF